MRVAFLTTDSREGSSLANNAHPYFGAAPEALLQGFAEMGSASLEVHVVSCVKSDLPAPIALAPNIYYHQLVLPEWSYLRSLHAGPVVAVRSLLNKLQPDVVHSQGMERWCALCGALSGRPSVLTIHGHIRSIMRRTRMQPYIYWYMQMLLGEWAIRHHQGVICISNHISNIVRGAARRAWLIPNAVRTPFLSVPAAQAPRAIPHFLVIGTITENKRPLELLRMFKSLHSSAERFRVTFVGHLGQSSRYGDAFREELASAKAAGFAKHCHYLDVDALINVLDAADALVHFPLEEAFGLVVAEALSRNLKLFASRVGGVVDIAQSAQGGGLFEPSDFGSLETSIKQWLDDGCPRSTETANLMRACYAPKRVAEKTLQVYNELTS
jgi:glycosyltransferase involved in cell wall biosynthesis